MSKLTDFKHYIVFVSEPQKIIIAKLTVVVRRVATCKPGKPGLTSFSETLALSSSNFFHFGK